MILAEFWYHRLREFRTVRRVIGRARYVATTTNSPIYRASCSSNYSSVLRNPPLSGYNAVVERPKTLDRIADLAEEQWGLVTRGQLENVEIPATTLERLTAPDSLLKRVAYGVYRLVGSPTPDHMELRAAWLQLAPNVPAWERTPAEGVVSHRSAAALYGVGHLPADRHEFTLARRKQSRRRDVRIHQRHLTDEEWNQLRGLPATRPARIVSDLLYDHEDPGAVAQIIVDAIRPVFDYPGAFAVSLTPHAARFGLRRDDGLALLRWLLDLVGDKDIEKWMQEARSSMIARSAPTRAPSVSRPAAPA